MILQIQSLRFLPRFLLRFLPRFLSRFLPRFHKIPKFPLSLQYLHPQIPLLFRE
jgi:hypothetical protein